MTIAIGMKRRALLAGGASLLVGAQARAQSFPSGRVTLVVPFPPGASTDVTMRVMADRLGQMWNQPVIVENKGGANGIIAAEAVMRAKPDGYTLFATSSMTHAGNPSLYEKLPYDAITDFEPISRMSLVPMVVLAHKGLKVKTLDELTARLKAEPGKHNYGAGALPARVASELYKLAAGVDAVYVGYKSNPQAIPDVQSGLLTFMMIDTVNAKVAIDRGALKGLFVTDSERYAAVPDLPTAAEAGLPEVLLTTWTGFYAPKGTPREIVDGIYRDIEKVAAMPEVLERLKTIGGVPKLMTPDEFGAFTRSEKERWGKIIHRANIKVE